MFTTVAKKVDCFGRGYSSGSKSSATALERESGRSYQYNAPPDVCELKEGDFQRRIRRSQYAYKTGRIEAPRLENRAPGLGPRHMF